MEKKFIIPIVILVLLVVVGLYQFNVFDESNNSTKTYSGNGISFNYPYQWIINKPVVNNEIISISANSGKIMLNVYKFNSTKNSTENITANYKSGLNLDPYAVNRTEINRTVDGLNATEITYISMDDESYFKESVLIFEKNGFTYVIQYNAFPPELYDQNKERFETVIGSFKVE